MGLAGQAFCPAALFTFIDAGPCGMATAAAVADAVAAPAKPNGRRRLLLLAIPVLLAGAGAGLWFSGVLPSLLGIGGHREPAHGAAGAAAAGGHEAAAAKPTASVELPEMVANLNAAPGRRAAFVKLHARIELSRAEDVAAAQAAMPRLLDLFQTYLRPGPGHRRAVHGVAGAMSDPSDEELAAAWGAETDAAAQPDAPPVQAQRVLNQAEIDSLLGFDDGPAGSESRTGMQKIISSGLVSYERLPMLEIVFDRLVRIMSTSLRNFTSDNVEVGIDNILSLRFGDYLNSIPLPAMLAVFKAEEWDNYGLMVVDSAMIYSIVDVLLGGRRGTAAMRIEGRPYTTIERTLVERLIQVVLTDLAASFDPLCPVTFRFERLEVNPRFATISRLSNAAVLARLRIDMEDRGGRLELLLPYATLEPVRELLLQQFMGEKFGRDSIWETHLAEELWSTDVDLAVVLDEQVMRLSEIMTLTPGSRIVLNCGPGASVQLRCGGTPLFEGKVGRRKNRVAVRIDREVPRNSAAER